MTYEYHLDPSSKKYRCPHCGKKTFVIYLDSDGRMLDSTVGRCDRKDKCGHHLPPREFFRAYADRYPRSESRKYSDRNLSCGFSRQPQHQAPDFLPISIIEKSLRQSDTNNLAQFLHGVFDALIGSDKVSAILRQYGVGTSKKFGLSPIFWQIDDKGRIRTGKVIGYNRANGKRVKGQNNWIHSMLKADHPDFRMRQCFFGAFRLQQMIDGLKAENEQRVAMGIDPYEPVVWLFESEKAALIVAMALEWLGAGRTFMPVACGGCDGLNPTEEKKLDPYDALSLLRDRKVVLFPDEGKLADWQRKAVGLRGYAKQVWVSTVMEPSHPYPVECAVAPGDALDDLILRYIAGNPDIVDSRSWRLAQLLTQSYR